MERKVICIVGPTCSGKTTLAIMLAEKLNGEIISADSRQIFKYLDIGTAKPSAAELKKTRHNFIDELNPDEDFNISMFEQEGLKVISDIFSRGKQPIVAGGSGLYVKALVDGIFNSADTDGEFRQELMEKKDRFGNEFIYNELKKIDPESAYKMRPSNWKRIIRALEVYHLTGRRIGDLQEKHERNTGFSFVQHGLKWERETLYNNIEKRVDEMIAAGLVNEVEKILAMGYGKDLNSLNTVGYKEIISHLDGEITLERSVELIKRNTRRFAKRQMTWFRKDERIKWHDVDKMEDLRKLAEEVN